MGRIKPAALLRQSKKQKAPARRSGTAIVASLVFLVMVLLSIAFISRQKSKQGIEPPSQYAVFNTTKGLLILELSGRHEPKTVENFVTHSQNGDYNGWRFYKVMNGLVIQGGHEGSNGIDGNSLSDVKVDDEAGTGLKYEPFTLIEETLGPVTNVNSSRLLITTTVAPHLSPDKHFVVGRIVGGQSVLQDMEYSLTDKSRQPLDHVVIYNILLRNSL